MKVFRSLLQKDYHKIHPRGELPVKEQDVYFSCHAVTMNLVLVLQCLMLDRGDQRIGISMGVLLCGLWISIASGLVTAMVQKVRWLTYLYYLSYIKVGTTPVKYAPQVSLFTLYFLFLLCCQILVGHLKGQSRLVLVQESADLHKDY